MGGGQWLGDMCDDVMTSVLKTPPGGRNWDRHAPQSEQSEYWIHPGPAISLFYPISAFTMTSGELSGGRQVLVLEPGEIPIFPPSHILGDIY